MIWKKENISKCHESFFFSLLNMNIGKCFYLFHWLYTVFQLLKNVKKNKEKAANTGSTFGPDENEGEKYFIDNIYW